MNPIIHKIATPHRLLSTTGSTRPTRRLLQSLPHLSITATQAPDFDCAPPALLAAIGEDAEATMSTIHLGLVAIGQLLAHAAPEVEDRTIAADSLESLGFLMAELGDLAAACMTLSAQCRRASQCASTPTRDASSTNSG